MKLNDTEKEIREQLQQQVPISDIVMQKVTITYQQIRQQKISRTTSDNNGKLLHPALKAAGSVAAVLILCLSIYGINPVFAKSLPLIGHLFEQLEQHILFQGNYSGKATVLDDRTAYSKTVNGLTVTFSEIYVDDQTIYLTILLENETAFPKKTMLEQYGRSDPAIYMNFHTAYSFIPETDNTIGLGTLEGTLLDDSTYTAVLRIDIPNDSGNLTEYLRAKKELSESVLNEMGITLEDLNDDTQEGQQLLAEYVKKVNAKDGYLASAYIQQYDIPGSFNLHLEIDSFSMTGDPDPVSSEPTHYTYRGETPWIFDIPVTLDYDQSNVIILNETNAAGIGLKSVTKTETELHVKELYTENGNSDTYLVVLDANGNKLPEIEYGVYSRSFAIRDHDVSTIDLFILDYCQYMDELKGADRFINNENKPVSEQWKTQLLANAKYHKTFHFD